MPEKAVGIVKELYAKCDGQTRSIVDENNPNVKPTS